MIETQERAAAHDVLALAIRKAHLIAGPGDLQAQTLAILMEALILSTPGLSADRRSRLFLEDGENEAPCAS
jgi:hypothetical protein